jgi:hypothetical protein
MPTIITIVCIPPHTSSAQKSTVGSDELLASYIAHLKCLEDLEKDRNIAYIIIMKLVLVLLNLILLR